MNENVLTNDRVFMAVVQPSGCRKLNSCSKYYGGQQSVPVL